MDNEDKITTKVIEALRSDVTKMSAKMAEEVVYETHQGSAASTVSGSTGSGGNMSNFYPGWCKTLSWPPESN